MKTKKIVSLFVLLFFVRKPQNQQPGGTHSKSKSLLGWRVIERALQKETVKFNLASNKADATNALLGALCWLMLVASG